MILHEVSGFASGDVHIPGGWAARVPTVQLRQDEEERYVKYLVSRGIPPERAAAQVRASMQAVFTRAWMQTLRLMLLKRAKEYRKINPDLGLRGFDPAALQVCYMPGENPGQRGKPFVKAILVEMGRVQREKEVRGRG